MTGLAVTLIDVVVLRGAGASLEALLLRRAADRSRPGSWEMVHGRIDAGETPVAAALRETREETGCAPTAFYSLSRTELFYRHDEDQVAVIPVFVAFLAPDAVVRLSEEHQDHHWLSPAEASARCAWPREARALADAVRLLGGGDAGAVEDVLRIC